MSKEIRTKIISESIKLLIISILVTMIDAVMLQYTVMDTLIGILLANTLLFASYWYTTITKRPILFVTLFTFCIGIGIYSTRYLEGNYVSIGGIPLYIAGGTGVVLLECCVVIVCLELKELAFVIKGHVDEWFPPLWSLVVLAFLALELDKTVDDNTKRLSALFLIVGFILVCFYKNGGTKTQELYYDVTLKGYFRHLILIAVVLVVGVGCIPKLDYLPGAKWLQQRNKNIIGDVATEIRLSRNPSQSEEILFKVKAELKPLYLREAAYDHYENGKWSMTKRNNKYHTLKAEDFKEASVDFYPQTQMRTADPFPLSAYIYEVKKRGNFQTVNGITSLQTGEESEIVYFDYIGHICLTEEKAKKHIGYTIEYQNRDILANYYKDGYIYQEKEGRFSKFHEEYKYLKDILEKWYTSDPNYVGIQKQYTQLPDDLRNNTEINSLAFNLTNKSITIGEKAKQIEQYLKCYGGFQYVMNAPYMDENVDPVYDFLINNNQGICQDFASAMVILCRSANVPARYVVGYYANELDQNDDFIVREKDGHAFVEVYVPTFGWMLFDPTPTARNSEAIGNAMGGIGNTYNMEIDIEKLVETGKNLLIVLLATAVIVAIVRLISYVLWKQKILKGNSGASIDDLTLKMLKKLDIKEYPIKDGETLQQLTKRMQGMGIDIEAITKPYDAYHYGGKEVSRIEVKQALECYTKLSKYETWKQCSKLK